MTLLVTASGCAAPGDGPPVISSRHLPTILDEVRDHPEKREAGVTACQRSVEQSDSDFPMNLFIGGLFDVPAHTAFGDFCAALVEAVIADDLTQADLDAFKRPSAIRGKGPLGTLLRKLMVAHERLRAQQAQGTTPEGLSD